MHRTRVLRRVNLGRGLLASPQQNEGQWKTEKSGRPALSCSTYLGPVFLNKANYGEYLLVHHVEAVVATNSSPTRAQSSPFHPASPRFPLPMPTVGDSCKTCNANPDKPAGNIHGGIGCDALPRCN